MFLKVILSIYRHLLVGLAEGCHKNACRCFLIRRLLVFLPFQFLAFLIQKSVTIFWTIPNNSNPDTFKVTISGNDGVTVGGIYNNTPSIPTIKNSIIWNNSGVTNLFSKITYGKVHGGFTGIGNLNFDPKFISSHPYGFAKITTGNYHVLADSHSIDLGENSSISTTDFDLDGKAL